MKCFSTEISKFKQLQYATQRIQIMDSKRNCLLIKQTALFYKLATCIGFMYSPHQVKVKICRGTCVIILKSVKKGAEILTLHWTVNPQA